VDPDEGQITKDPGLMSASAKSDWSQSDTDISNVEERMYQSGKKDECSLFCCFGIYYFNHYLF
jgi:hypothetical protein